MQDHERQERHWSARSINRSLFRLFLLLWLCVGLQLHGCLHQEIWPHGPLARIMAALPPIVPVVALFSGHALAAGLYVLLTSATALLWLLAVRRPAQSSLRVAARTAIVLYWLLLWLPLAHSA